MDVAKIEIFVRYFFQKQKIQIFLHCKNWKRIQKRIQRNIQIFFLRIFVMHMFNIYRVYTYWNWWKRCRFVSNDNLLFSSLKLSKKWSQTTMCEPSFQAILFLKSRFNCVEWTPVANLIKWFVQCLPDPKKWSYF